MQKYNHRQPGTAPVTYLQHNAHTHTRCLKSLENIQPPDNVCVFSVRQPGVNDMKKSRSINVMARNTERYGDGETK